MSEKPNLLFLFTDEQAANTIRFMGNGVIETPNLDRLCGISHVFQNAYVSQPVCTPSRATLLTGLYPHTHGLTENNLVLDDSIHCLPEMPGLSGYKSAYYGKWHLGDETHAQHGFADWESVDDGYHDYDTPKRDPAHRSGYYHWLVENGFGPDVKDSKGHPYFSRGFCVRLPEEYNKAAYVGMMASQYIKDHAGEPFILYANFFEPHMPFSSPLDSYYDWREIPLPANFDAIPDETFPYKAQALARLYHAKYQTQESWKQLIGRYYGQVTMLDRQVGRILDALEQSGIQDDTLVVFTSDHGDMMGSHQLSAKCVMYEEAIKVPMMIKLPGQTQTVLHEQRVSQIDMVPTLLEALGAPAYAPLEGESLMPCLNGSGRADRDVIVEWNGPNNGFGDAIGHVSIPEPLAHLLDRERLIRSTLDPVRTIITQDGWKYSMSAIYEDVLINLNADPMEIKNLAHEPSHAETVRILRERIKRWQSKTCDRPLVNV